ncbi:hypothetical protein L3Q82_000704 [Scortum barcoo]|uniref:Uncharacterized protein n=1 Tax=Scortum barcoo TaxID=214431 RepID=A0ACB8WDV8_9TELE|nr:hypothetical protein L3Q82_000704 [Scortum barcoo]
MSFLRRVAGRSLRDRVRSSVTREELGVEPLLLHIERSQLRWLGHLFRMPPGRLPKEAFQACPTGRRPREEDPGHAGETMSLGWPGKCLGVPLEELEEVSGCLCSYNMKCTWLPSSLLLPLLLEVGCVSLGESGRPNFVLLMVDDLGIGDLGCYGNTTLSVHGFNYFFGIPLTNLRDCLPGHSTVFQIQKYIPYQTLAIVLVTAVLLHYSSIVTLRRGLILSLLALLIIVMGLITGFIMMIPYFNCVLMRNHKVVEQPFAPENLTQRMTHEATDFIERNSAKPFLLFFSFLQVHTAMFASSAFRGTSRHGIYGDAVHEVDWSVGQIMQTLDRLKLRENTLVYLTSDQGAHLEEISATGDVHRGWNGIYKGSSVWKAFYFTPNFWPENETACFHTHVCFCTAEYVTYHDPPLLFDLSRDPSETTPITPDTEPNFHSILAMMKEAVEAHQRSVKPVEKQMSVWNLMWKPWLQPCCSTLTQFCQCQQDK